MSLTVSLLMSLLFEVSFADCPVPNGTPVYLQNYVEAIGGDPRLVFHRSIIFTETRLDTEIDASRPRSYASIPFEPLSSENGFDEGVIFTTDYNKIGEVEREVTLCTRITWNPADEAGDGDFDIYTATSEAIRCVVAAFLTTTLHGRN